MRSPREESKRLSLAVKRSERWRGLRELLDGAETDFSLKEQQKLTH